MSDAIGNSFFPLIHPKLQLGDHRAPQDQKPFQRFVFVEASTKRSIDLIGNASSARQRTPNALRNLENLNKLAGNDDCWKLPCTLVRASSPALSQLVPTSELGDRTRQSSKPSRFRCAQSPWSASRHVGTGALALGSRRVSTNQLERLQPQCPSLSCLFSLL